MPRCPIEIKRSWWRSQRDQQIVGGVPTEIEKIAGGGPTEIKKIVVEFNGVMIYSELVHKHLLEDSRYKSSVSLKRKRVVHVSGGFQEIVHQQVVSKGFDLPVKKIHRFGVGGKDSTK